MSRPAMDDTEQLLADSEAARSQQPDEAFQRTFSARRVILTSVALVATGLAMAAVAQAMRPAESFDILDRTSGGPFQGLSSVPKECSAYTDCAALNGDCCPNDDGVMLGCCSMATLAVGSQACEDTPGWTNGYKRCNERGFTEAQGCVDEGVTCKGYEHFGLCIGGVKAKGKDWAFSEALNSAEMHCCACGKGTPAAALGVAVNGSQGEPGPADCALSSCAELGITGSCCPTEDGTMLGCCAGLSAGPQEPSPLLPPAQEPGPRMTFYMFRVADNQDYPLNGVNMANLAGDMWYLHNEVVGACPRKFNIERLVRYKVTMRATRELYGQSKSFDSFVAMDQAKCTVPECAKLHWDPLGYVVGCQPNDAATVAVPGTPVWYSLPGTCPSKFYYEKTAACEAAEPGGMCPDGHVTGTRNCTYYFEKAGEIKLDELSGIKDYNTVCEEKQVLEYDVFTDKGHGTDFWNGKKDAEAGRQRMQTISDLFEQKFPDSATLSIEYSPTCER